MKKSELFLLESGFIAKGTDMDYRAVSLTESGREALKAIRNEGVI
jgi:predicted transcriptional regulator